jgi:signal transduction histidine kinase
MVDGRRVVVVGSIALTGLTLLGGAAASVGDPNADSGVALVLIALGGVLGVVLTGGGVALYRSDVRTSHTARIAGWNLLGVAVLGLVVVLARRAPGVALPLYVVVNVLGVSSVAHVLIGYNDVRRIRAEDLARQRRTLAVVNRVARHNLRNATQVLAAYASQLTESVDDPDDRQAAETIHDTAMGLSDLYERLREFQSAVEDERSTRPIELAPLIEDLLTEFRDECGPDAVESGIPEGLTVTADEHLETALNRLVENALTHGSPDDPVARVSAREDGDRVAVSVSDNGPGLPETERAILTDESDVNQLDHGSGLGLWVVRAAIERYDGDIDIETGDGTTVTLWLPR